MRQYNSVKLITAHPEFNHITTVIMMVLDYLNSALKVGEGGSVGLGGWREAENKDYDSVLDRLASEVKSWSFIYRKGEAKYEFEDCDSATFFLSYSWELLKQYFCDLYF